MHKPIATPYNAKLEQVKGRAQFAANLERKPVAVLNLNACGTLYVIRNWDDRMQGDRQLICKIEPHPINVDACSNDACRNAGECIAAVAGNTITCEAPKD